MEQIVAEITAERGRQDARFGGPAQDDTRQCTRWINFILDQANKAILDHRTSQTAWAPTIVRARLVKIAALAVAGIQSIDRQHPGAKP